jgi:GTP-binding protein
LRHIERTTYLLHLIDISEWASQEPVASFEVLRQELTAYDEALASRPFAVVATKIDVSGTSDRLAQLQAYCRDRNYVCLPISAATGAGLGELVAFVGKQVEHLRATLCETNS